MLHIIFYLKAIIEIKWCVSGCIFFPKQNKDFRQQQGYCAVHRPLLASNILVSCAKEVLPSEPVPVWPIPRKRTIRTGLERRGPLARQSFSIPSLDLALIAN